MNDTAQALDRTLRIVRNLIGMAWSDGQILDALLTTNVALVADGRNLSTVSGQACLTTLFGLLAAYGCNIKLSMPPVPIVGHQPPLRGRDLLDALLDLGCDVIPGVAAKARTKTTDDDLVFILGDTSWCGAARMAWRVAGTSWSGSTQPPDTSVNSWQTSIPVGALTAAAIASAEPFKDALRHLARTRTGTSPVWTLEAVQSASVDFDELAVSKIIDIGAIDFISGGAITNASLHALLRIPGARGVARVIEPESIELSNLNRYALVRRSDLHRTKLEAIQRQSSPEFGITARREAVSAETIQGIRPLAPLVAMGVDNLPSRWLVQGEWPAWLSVGATAVFLAMSSEHRATTGCAGCLHDRDDGVNVPIPTVSFVSYWAGLMLAVRILRQALGMSEWHDRKALMVYPLRLDSQSAVLWRPVPPNSNCPVECGKTAFKSDLA